MTKQDHIAYNWNIKARYPDYKLTLHKIATSTYMEMHVEKVKGLLQWLQEKL